MELAGVILSTISLVISIICLVLMLAKNFFSTHNVQMVPVNPMEDFAKVMGGEIGGNMADPYRDLGEPISQEEIDRLHDAQEKRKRKMHQNTTLE